MTKSPRPNRLADLRTSVERSLRHRHTKFIVVDEAAHLIRQCHPRRIEQQLDTLKSLSNECSVQWILLGSYDLFDLVSLSGQLARRTHVIHFNRYRLPALSKRCQRHPGATSTRTDRSTVARAIGRWPRRNPSSEPMIWLDGLDVPIVALLDAQFMESGPESGQEITRAANVNFAQFGNTMTPVNYQPRSQTSPMFWYPYERTREALETLKVESEIHPCWGHKLQYTNPVTGAWAMPAIGTFMQLLPAGFQGEAYKSTDSTVYAVVEGTGRCIIGESTLTFGPKDVFVCPSWMPYRLEADSDAVLFSYSDRPVQQALDLWREALG